MLAQRLSQINGVGQVIVGGARCRRCASSSIRRRLFKYGIGLEDVRAALASANANSPKGAIDDGDRRFQIYTNDQATKAADYTPLVIAYRNGAAVRLSRRRRRRAIRSRTCAISGLSNGKPSVLVILFRQPGANIIETVDSVKAELPQLEAAMPADVERHDRHRPLDHHPRLAARHRSGRW